MRSKSSVNGAVLEQIRLEPETLTADIAVEWLLKRVTNKHFIAGLVQIHIRKSIVPCLCELRSAAAGLQFDNYFLAIRS